GCCGECLGSAIAAIPPVRVSANAIAAPSTHQVVDGLLQSFPYSIPARDFDGRDRAHFDLAAIRIDVAKQSGYQQLRLKDFEAQYERLDFVNGGLDGFGEMAQ